MTRQELIAWISFVSTAALVILYSVLAFGLSLDDGQWSLLWKVIVAVTVLEVVIDYSRGRDRVERDERDDTIEARGIRNAYRVLMVAIVILIGHSATVNVLWEGLDPVYLERMRWLTLHYLVYVAAAASLIKSGTRIYLYERGK